MHSNFNWINNEMYKNNTDPLFEYKAQNAERRFYTDNAF